MTRSRRASIALAVVVLVAQAPAAVLAHDPTAWTRRYSADNQNLGWDFGGTYPSWLTSVATDIFNNHWDDSATNNSRSPQFSSGGSGTVYYSSSLTSPCSGGTVWLACATGGGTTSWRIYIRNLDTAPYSDWTWLDKTGSCPSGDTCFKLGRTLIHEPIHVTFGTIHNEQGTSNTVFSAGQPSYANTGGSVTYLKRCDEAAAQLAYDLRDMAGPYGDCFDDITNAGATGLVTDLTVTTTVFDACQGAPITINGRLQVHDYSSYYELGANPLKSRKVYFDINGSANAAYVTATETSSPNNNWGATFSNASYGSRSYVAHFDAAAGSGLVDSPNRSFSITWVPSSLC